MGAPKISRRPKPDGANVTFDLERETKNTYRFQEVAKGGPPVIGTLYIQKWAFEATPPTITVTIRP